MSDSFIAPLTPRDDRADGPPALAVDVGLALVVDLGPQGQTVKELLAVGTVLALEKEDQVLAPGGELELHVLLIVVHEEDLDDLIVPQLESGPLGTGLGQVLGQLGAVVEGAVDLDPQVAIAVTGEGDDGLALGLGDGLTVPQGLDGIGLHVMVVVVVGQDALSHQHEQCHELEHVVPRGRSEVLLPLPKPKSN